MQMDSQIGRWIKPVAGGVVAMTLAGCACNPAPSHVAIFWTQNDENVVVQLHGQKPTIEITNRGPGPIGRLEIVNGEEVATLPGIPPRGSSMFTLRDGSGVRIADSSGARAEIKIWAADTYDLKSEKSTKTASK